MFVLRSTHKRALDIWQAERERFDAVLELLREQLAASEARYQQVMADLRVVTGITPRKVVSAPTPDAEIPAAPQRPPTEFERQAGRAHTPRQFKAVVEAEMARKWAEQEMAQTAAALAVAAGAS
jgi:hypothetical protein